MFDWKRLVEIEAMPKTRLSAVTLWSTREDEIKRRIDQFAAHDLYIGQSNTREQYDRLAQYVKSYCKFDERVLLRDAEYGASVVTTNALGDITRSALDAAVECDFLRRHLPNYDMRVLDVGAGYGRLATAIEAYIPSLHVTCVDAVPLSTFLCEWYTKKYAPKVKTIHVSDINSVKCDLAINVHSWNECNCEQVQAWVDKLLELGTQYLFTVSNDSTWYTIVGRAGGRGPSFRPILERHFDIVAEEFIGMDDGSGKGCPHVLWKRKELQPMPRAKIVMIQSLPRIGFVGTQRCIALSCAAMGLELWNAYGCWWEHGLQNLLEDAVNQDFEFVVAVDYDSLFTYTDLSYLMQTMLAQPEIDVLSCIETKRDTGQVMVNFAPEIAQDGQSKEIDLMKPIPVLSAHFGLTVIRSSSLKKIPLPWFQSFPNNKGQWREGMLPADMYFWKKILEHGLKPFILPAVSIGHTEVLVSQFNIQTGKPVYKFVHEWDKVC